MLLECLKCRKSMENKNPRVVKTKRVRPILLSKCAVCVVAKNQDLLKRRKLVDYF